MSDINDKIDDKIDSVEDSLGGTAPRKQLAAHEVDNITEVVNEVMQMMVAELDARLANKGIKTSPIENLKLKGMKKGLEAAQKYSAKFNSEARMDAFVAATNKALPTITEIFGEAALAAKIPQQLKDQRVVTLCEKAGATELAGLISRSMAIKPA